MSYDGVARLIGFAKNDVQRIGLGETHLVPRTEQMLLNALDLLVDSEKRADNSWQQIALYLADCHAATAEHVLGLKSASKAERKRQLSICKMALDSIRAGQPVNVRMRPAEAIVQRLEELLKRHKEEA